MQFFYREEMPSQRDSRKWILLMHTKHRSSITAVKKMIFLLRTARYAPRRFTNNTDTIPWLVKQIYYICDYHFRYNSNNLEPKLRIAR